MKYEESGVGIENIDNKNKERFEDEKNPNLLAEEMISEMKSGLDVFGGAEDMRKFGTGVVLENQKAENEIKNDPDTMKRLDDIANNAKKAFIEAQKAMKKAIAIGMATMAFSGTAEKFSGNIEESLKNFDLISSAKATEGKGEMTLTYGEEAKQRMIDRIKSQTYLERLTKEFDGDIEKAKIMRQKRLNDVRRVHIEYFDTEDEISGVYKIINGIDEKNPVQVDGFVYIPENKEEPAEIGALRDRSGNTIDHELGHVSNRNGENIPEKTRKRFEKINISNNIKAEFKKYAMDPTEILGRRQAIDAKMEELGIKKYEETCTREHLEKLINMELEMAGIKSDEELSKLMLSGEKIPEGIEFISIYGWDVEYIFNEIANNEYGANNNREIS